MPRLYPFSLKAAICLTHNSHPRLNENLGRPIVQLHGEKASLLALSLSRSLSLLAEFGNSNYFSPNELRVCVRECGGRCVRFKRCESTSLC